MGLIVKNTYKDSIADELGIGPGFTVVSINGSELNNIIDYEYLITEDYISVVVTDPQKETVIFDIEKDPDEDLGIDFESTGLEKKHTCRNKCIFCFVDQLPPDMRKTLYFKDDDWRFSFLMGNYITLSNISDEDFNIILNRRISPLYISVHSTDDSVRNSMIGIKKNFSIMEKLHTLADNKITVHAQIVLCPGINDGKILIKSIEDLYSLYPYVKSLAVVPVGLTKHRTGLYPLNPVNKEDAFKTIEVIKKYSDIIRQKHNSSFVYASDEMYIRAGIPLPSYDEYDDFVQIENGVGLIAFFADEFITSSKNKKIKESSFTLVTGADFYSYLFNLVKQYPNIKTEKIVNGFLGKSVTVTGLLSGKDVSEQLKKRSLNETVILPGSMFNADGLTIDDYSSDKISSIINRPCIVADPTGSGLAEVLFD